MTLLEAILEEMDAGKNKTTAHRVAMELKNSPDESNHWLEYTKARADKQPGKELVFKFKDGSVIEFTEKHGRYVAKAV